MEHLIEYIKMQMLALVLQGRHQPALIQWVILYRIEMLARDWALYARYYLDILLCPPLLITLDKGGRIFSLKDWPY